jgi:hypothetical protein
MTTLSMSHFDVQTEHDSLPEANLAARTRREPREIGEKLPDHTYFSKAC